MTKRQGRLFFIVCTALFSTVFIALTIDSHRQFGKLDQCGQDYARRHRGQARLASEELHQLPHAARRGCLLCAGPDEDRAAPRRSLPATVPPDPSQFYSEERHGRLMPNPNLSERPRSTAVIAFLDWISRSTIKAGHRGRSWSRRGVTAGHRAVGPPSPAASADPVRRARRSSSSIAPACFGCHSLQQGVTLVGPSLAGLVTPASLLLTQRPTTRQCEDAAGVHQRIDRQSQRLSGAGADVSRREASRSCRHSASVLKPEQIDELVAYLATLK